jgi:hypothetical protein
MAHPHLLRVRSCLSFYPLRIESTATTGQGAFPCLLQPPQRLRAVVLALTPNFEIYRCHLPVILVVLPSRELGLMQLSFALPPVCKL